MLWGLSDFISLVEICFNNTSLKKHQALREVAMIVKPETILTWYRKLIAAKFDSSKKRKKKVGRPLTDCELEILILQISKRNPRWGYDRILFGEKSLRRTLRAFLTHYHEERNHQGKGNRLLFPIE